MKKTKILNYETNKEFPEIDKKVVKNYKDLLINNKMINKEDDLILISEEQIKLNNGVNLRFGFLRKITLEQPI